MVILLLKCALKKEGFVTNDQNAHRGLQGNSTPTGSGDLRPFSLSSGALGTIVVLCVITIALFGAYLFFKKCFSRKEDTMILPPVEPAAPPAPLPVKSPQLAARRARAPSLDGRSFGGGRGDGDAALSVVHGAAAEALEAARRDTTAALAARLYAAALREATAERSRAAEALAEARAAAVAAHADLLSSPARRRPSFESSSFPSQRPSPRLSGLADRHHAAADDSASLFSQRPAPPPPPFSPRSWSQPSEHRYGAAATGGGGDRLFFEGGSPYGAPPRGGRRGSDAASNRGGRSSDSVSDGPFWERDSGAPRSPHATLRQQGAAWNRH